MKKQITRFLATVTMMVAVALPLSGAFAAAKALPTQAINVNTASAQELTALPGIGKAKADAIVAYRDAHPFKDVSELTEVKGIGPKMLEKLTPYVTIDGSAPTALPSSASK